MRLNDQIYGTNGNSRIPSDLKDEIRNAEKKINWDRNGERAWTYKHHKNRGGIPMDILMVITSLIASSIGDAMLLLMIVLANVGVTIWNVYVSD